MSVLLLDSFLDHSPQWLVGWNNFASDYFCLMHWAAPEYEKYLESVVVRSSSSNQMAYILEVPMTYNVDMCVYIDRSRRGAYKNVSLSAIAPSEDVSNKTSMPRPGEEQIPERMVKYNMSDSKVKCEL